MNPSLLSQARELKSKLDKAQKELSTTMVEASSGKGAVKVTMNCQQKIQSIKISPQVINPDKPQVLEELVLKAVTEAIANLRRWQPSASGALNSQG